MIFFILDVALTQLVWKLNIAEQEVIKLLADVKAVAEEDVNLADSVTTDFAVCPRSN